MSTHGMFDDVLGTDSDVVEGTKLKPIPGELHEVELASLLGLSTNSVRAKAREGILVKTRPAYYAVEESIGNYVQRLREAASRSGGRPTGGSSDELKIEKLRHERARADSVELKNAQLRNELIAVTDVRTQWVTIATDLRAAILAIPARVAARSGLTREAAVLLEKEVRMALEQIDDDA